MSLAFMNKMDVTLKFKVECDANSVKTAAGKMDSFGVITDFEFICG